MRACVRACVRLSHFYISLIYKDLFAKFAENVYGCENMSVKNLVLILKNNMAAIAGSLKIIDMFLNLKYYSIKKALYHYHWS